MRKKILIVLNHLTIGGVQKTLVTASKVFDYEKYDVTIYLRKNRTDLLPYIDKRANIIINNDTHHYYRKPYCVILQAMIWIFNFLGKKLLAKKFKDKLKCIVTNYTMKYEYKKYFKNSFYDIAIAYVHGYPALLVNKYVHAKQKIIFFRESEDCLHEIHNEIIDDFDKVLSLHDAQKKLIAQWYPSIKDRIEILENYTDKNSITEQSKAFNVKTPKNKIVLCSCGRIEKVKGFGLAVETAKILKEHNLEFIWYFVGDGSERAIVEKKIKQYNLCDHIVITGMEQNPYPYIAACDIYVQPSFAESLGNTMVEANKLNKAVISTSTVGGKKLIINEINGLLCETNAQSLSQAILKLVSNQELRKQITDYLKNLDYSKELQKYKEQWNNVLEG